MRIKPAEYFKAEVKSILDNHTMVGDQYLRQCESHIIAQEKIKQEFTKHGTNHVNLPFLMCDYDGSFGGYNIDNGMYVFFFFFFYVQCQIKVK